MRLGSASLLLHCSDVFFPKPLLLRLTGPRLAQNSLSFHSAWKLGPSSTSRNLSFQESRRKSFHSLRNSPFNSMRPCGSLYAFSQMDQVQWDACTSRREPFLLPTRASSFPWHSSTHQVHFLLKVLRKIKHISRYQTSKTLQDSTKTGVTAVCDRDFCVLGK